MKSKPENSLLVDQAEKATKEIKKNRMSDTKAALRNYVVDEIITDFSQIPETLKLTILQKTPKSYIRGRQLGGTNVLYTPYEYNQKALNFVFNFQVSCEQISHDYLVYEEEYFDFNDPKCQRNPATGKKIPIKKKRVVTEAEVVMKFTFKSEKGDIVRTVCASHKGFKNPATTRGHILASAISKSWTVVAGTFGIGKDLEKDLEYARNSEENEPVKDETSEVPNVEIVEGDNDFQGY